MQTNETLLARFLQVEKQVADACQRAGRRRSEVTLVAVSKTKPEEQLTALLAAGAVHFGENKVQDLCRKMQDIPEAGGNIPVWHMIGRLQTNKVKYLIESPVALIHSVDSLKLAAAIEKEAEKKHRASPIRVLLEINIGGEESKGGFTPEEAESMLPQIAAFSHLKVCGLMTVCPPGLEEENRCYFKQMRLLRDKLCALNVPGVELTELSMGMSDDYCTAIEEGATIVRVGSAIFGARNYGEPEWSPAIQDALDLAANEQKA